MYLKITIDAALEHETAEDVRGLIERLVEVFTEKGRDYKRELAKITVHYPAGDNANVMDYLTFSKELEGRGIVLKQAIHPEIATEGL